MTTIISSLGFPVYIGTDVQQVENGLFAGDTLYPSTLGFTSTETDPPEDLMLWQNGAWVADTAKRAAAQEKLLEAMREELEEALDEYIDGVALSEGFGNKKHNIPPAAVTSARSWAARPGEYQAAGARVADWADAVWVTAIAIQTAVLTGQRAIPTKAQLLAELPAYPLA